MKGIMFSQGLIPEVMDGTKTQTRRVEKCLEEVNKNPDDWMNPVKVVRDIPPVKEGDFILAHKDGHTEAFRTRYKDGETVYVKEVHYAYGNWSIWDRNGWHFTKDTSVDKVLFKDNPPEEYMTKPSYVTEWYKRSPLFLPEKYARTFLKIKDVRIERIQDITGGDCIDEGIILPFRVYGDGDDAYLDMLEESYINDFRKLWNSINKDNSWDRNIWIPVYEFEKV